MKLPGKLLLSALLLSSSSFAGCGGDDAPPPDYGDRGCEALDPIHCALPWPSSFFLVADPTTDTGFRVDLPEELMPVNRLDEPLDTEIIQRFDGFSPMTTMMTVFEGEIDDSNLPDEAHIADSLAPNSPTIVIDAETGERVAHFSELDRWPRTDRTKAPFYIRPATRLAENRRYVVAIRDIVRVDGSAVEPKPAFRALRDGERTGVEEIDGRGPAMEEIFGILETAGVPRDDLLIAWDFHTASGPVIWRDIVTVRDDLLGRLNDGFGCTAETVEEDFGDDSIFRRVRGTFTVPLYMTSAEPGGRLVRDAEGTPMFAGMAEAPFTFSIPHSVREHIEGGGDPVRFLTYGHGLFGDHGELDSGFVRPFLDRTRMVGASTDWQGMSKPDVVVAGEILTKLGDFPKLTERLIQGVMNFITLTRSIAGVCSQEPWARIDDVPVVDPTALYYQGNSQGGIMGATLAAMSPDIQAFGLGVGGVSYPIMMKRSSNFGPFAAILDTWYSYLDADVLLVMSSSQWDLSEPATFAPHLVRDPLPGSTAKRILYQIGTWDTQVPNISSDIAVRSMGIPRMVPSVREVYDMEETMGPAESAYVEYLIDGVEPWPPGTRSPPASSPAHEGVRRNDAAQLQMDAFFQPGGLVESFCDGPCDPE